MSHASAGGFIVAAPGAFLALLQLPPTTDPWLRVLGVPIMSIGLLHVACARTEQGFLSCEHLGPRFRVACVVLSLLTFGGLTLESADGPPPRLRPQRLAILAVLAVSERGVSRERMYGVFWPAADEERARHALRQALYALRQELAEDVVQPEAVLLLDRSRVVR